LGNVPNWNETFEKTSVKVDWRKSDAFYFGLESFGHPVWLCQRGYDASRTPAARHCSFPTLDFLKFRFGFWARAAWAADATSRDRTQNHMKSVSRTGVGKHA
jgi:hypothetical protein